MKLKLKEQFIGTIITKKIPLKPMQMVNLTFDSTKIEEENYIKYYNLGFEELFDIEKEEELIIQNVTYITEEVITLTEEVITVNEETKNITIDYNGEENKPIKKTRKPRKRKETNE